MKIKNLSILIILFILGLFVFPISNVNAFEIKSSDKITISKEQTVDGTLFANGQDINIQGQVTGDVFCAGGNILISGTVEGDVLCVGQNLIINGIVKGDIRGAGQSIELSGQVDHSVTLAGQELSLINTVVGGDAQIFGQNIKVSGQIDKSIISAGQNIILSGSVGKDVMFAGSNVTLTDTAAVGGDLTYSSEKPANINPGAVVTGLTQKKDLKIDKKTPQILKPKFNFIETPKLSYMSILIWIGLGLLFLALFPEFFRRTASKIKNRPLSCLGYGFLIMLLSPSIFLFLLVTIIGIPLAVFGLIFLIVTFFVSRLFVAAYLGEKLMTIIKPENKVNLVLAQILGIIVLFLAFKIPFLGPVLSLLTSLIGTGALLLNSKSVKGK